ncbi:MAG: ABC transporter permease [Nocardioidaceae bacterium]
MIATEEHDLSTLGVASPPAPGLRRAGARLPVDEYTRRLWQRRWFIEAYASATNAAGYERSFIGQYWQLLTPLLNIAVYYLIFGLLLHTNKGVGNFIGYLTVGVFWFHFLSHSMIAGSKAITGNSGLVRALQFPRAVLPVATTLQAFLQLLNSLAVMIPILLLTGEPITWHWLLLVPALVLTSMFCLSVAFVTARIGALVPDTTQVLPFVSRVWLYASGVMFNMQAYTQGHTGILTTLFELNPGNVYLELARSCVIVGIPASPTTWLLGVLWAVVPLGASYLYFWRGEEGYGNV